MRGWIKKKKLKVSLSISRKRNFFLTNFLQIFTVWIIGTLSLGYHMNTCCILFACCSFFFPFYNQAFLRLEVILFCTAGKAFWGKLWFGALRVTILDPTHFWCQWYDFPNRCHLCSTAMTQRQSSGWMLIKTKASPCQLFITSATEEETPRQVQSHTTWRSDKDSQQVD